MISLMNFEKSLQNTNKLIIAIQFSNKLYWKDDNTYNIAQKDEDLINFTIEEIRRETKKKSHKKWQKFNIRIG